MNRADMERAAHIRSLQVIHCFSTMSLDSNSPDFSRACLLEVQNLTERTLRQMGDVPVIKDPVYARRSN